jgi:thiamine-phosphate pyrophosphorylase
VPTVLNDEVEGLAGLTSLPGAGLHLGQHDTPAEVARQKVGPLALLGLSTHDVAQVQGSAALPVDYIGFGPIHATLGKRGHDTVVGVDGLRLVVSHARVPVVAIGGIMAQDLQPLRNAGAHAAAVIGAWLGPAGQPWSPSRAGATLRDLVAVWSRPENTP